MDKYMEQLKKQYKEIPIPSELDTVVKKSLGKQRSGRPHVQWIAGVAAAAVIFTASLNISPAIAKSLMEVPVIGSIVNVLTIQEYRVDEGNYHADIRVPAVDSMENTALEQSLNAKYLAESQALYEQFMAKMRSDQAIGEDGHLSVDSGYVVKTDTEQLLSIGRYVEETEGSSMTTLQYDTIDKQNELLVTLPGLFQDASYIEVISQYIQDQMLQQMEADPAKVYFISTAENPVWDGFEQIAEDENFYINADHQLVISFDEYEVAPGYMGVVEFVIPTEVLQDILVSNEYLK